MGLGVDCAASGVALQSVPLLELGVGVFYDVAAGGLAASDFEPGFPFVVHIVARGDEQELSRAAATASCAQQLNRAQKGRSRSTLAT